ncbi:cold-shock protein [Corynebacterium sp. 13CS0277]|uniref:cold-shock protein n=1 Tax=Corynebacterium sp. 13CS0277 TaxID=2071994 RepID=UPI000D02A3DA|nr:cold shock domain-containing protein [Corynebacterium sp. 13CS0277]PRQ10992.1 cold-shock protein [Corynebacterium sp. 13CS0277]
MPIGKVKWYDADRGFGFVANPGAEDAFVGKAVLPDGVDELYPGQRIEFDVADGRRGPQALRVVVLDEAPRRRSMSKYTSEQLSSMISDLVTMLETTIQPDLQKGHRVDRKTGRQVAEILRAVAKELDA